MLSHRERTCCFTGHREIPQLKKAKIEQELDSCLRGLIARGYNNFAAGGAVGFDTIAAQCVIRLRNEFPQLKLTLILPCMDQAKKWSANQAYEYEMIKFHADEIIFLNENYTKGCFQQRNRALVDASSVCVAYLTRKSGGTAYTCAYAEKNGVEVINIAETDRDTQTSLF